MTQPPLWEFARRRRPSVRHLSKARVLAGLQCLKRLHYETYEPDLRSPVGPGRRAILEAGKAVGEVARKRYPGGVAIPEEAGRHDQAVRETKAALSRPTTCAIYEAAFTWEEIRVRVDILARTEDGWRLVEVKSSSGFKEEYLSDLALQLMALEGNGVAVESAALLHVNSQYVWDGGAYDVNELFAEEELSRFVRASVPSLRTRLARMREVLLVPEPPDVGVGPHCRKPYTCPFYDVCHDRMPEHHISSLPRLTPKMYAALLAAEIEDIRDIPDDFEGFGDLQRRVRDSVSRGEPFRHPDLKTELERIRYPVHFLDFETCNPPLPIIPGTRPFQQTPFEWSDHVLEPDGTIHHHSYLHTLRSDPRPTLTDALLNALAGEGSIVVYSGFEARVIRSLADALPAWADRLLPVETRMIDLHHLIHSNYYHPNFHGSFSIKDVLPALVAGLDYKDLAIQEGSQAALAFATMTHPETDAEERGSLRNALLAYCSRDTMAMLRLFQTLKGLS
jgi:Domain of unknown function(DUF2779)/Domain of unknown function DUF83